MTPARRRDALRAMLAAVPQTPLDYLHRYWREVPEDQLIQFLTEMLTPPMRRLLLHGVEEEDTRDAPLATRGLPQLQEGIMETPTPFQGDHLPALLTEVRRCGGTGAYAVLYPEGMGILWLGLAPSAALLETVGRLLPCGFPLPTHDDAPAGWCFRVEAATR